MAVYFIRCTGTGNVKIGYTDKNPLIRLGELQTGTSYKLELFKFLPTCDRSDEKWLHELFKKDHIRGEWFTNEVLYEISVDRKFKTIYHDIYNVPIDVVTNDKTDTEESSIERFVNECFEIDPLWNGRSPGLGFTSSYTGSDLFQAFENFSRYKISKHEQTRFLQQLHKLLKRNFPKFANVKVRNGKNLSYRYFGVLLKPL